MLDSERPSSHRPRSVEDLVGKRLGEAEIRQVARANGFDDVEFVRRPRGLRVTINDDGVVTHVQKV